MSDSYIISKTNYNYLYWNMAQQIAHHTITGCNMNAGDMLASGTISGDNPDSYGSMLELSWKGTKPIKMSNGEERTFIENEDTVIMTGYAQGDDYRIGFGEVKGTILP